MYRNLSLMSTVHFCYDYQKLSNQCPTIYIIKLELYRTHILHAHCAVIHMPHLAYAYAYAKLIDRCGSTLKSRKGLGTRLHSAVVKNVYKVATYKPICLYNRYVIIGYRLACVVVIKIRTLWSRLHTYMPLY